MLPNHRWFLFHPLGFEVFIELFYSKYHFSVDDADRFYNSWLDSFCRRLSVFYIAQHIMIEGVVWREFCKEHNVSEIRH